MRKPHLDVPAGRAVFKHVNAMAHRTGMPVHSIALRYALERFLHRLFAVENEELRRLFFNPGLEVGIDQSAVTLKGGLTMTFAEGVPPHEGRTTGDADLHLASFRGGMGDYAAMLARGLALEPDGEDDGVRFDADAVSVSRDREERSGGSVTIPLQLGQIRLQIKTDVTFDARPMHERALLASYPSIVPEAGMAPAVVRRVPWEFMLADKIGAAFENGMLNKRVRDYADMRLVLGTQAIDDPYLSETLAGTMRFKGLPLPDTMETAPGFSDAYAASKAERWEHEKVNKRFLVRDPLPEILPWLRTRLTPVLAASHQVERLPEWAFGPR